MSADKRKAWRIAQSAYHFCLTGGNMLGSIGKWKYEVCFQFGEVFVVDTETEQSYVVAIRKSWR